MTSQAPPEAFNPRQPDSGASPGPPAKPNLAGFMAAMRFIDILLLSAIQIPVFFFLADFWIAEVNPIHDVERVRIGIPADTGTDWEYGRPFLLFMLAATGIFIAIYSIYSWLALLMFGQAPGFAVFDMKLIDHSGVQPTMTRLMVWSITNAVLVTFFLWPFDFWLHKKSSRKLGLAERISGTKLVHAKVATG